MRIVNFSNTRDSLKDVIDQVIEDADVTVISRRDAPDAVVMSFDHYRSLMETERLLSSPANAAHLARSISQLRAGKCRWKRCAARFFVMRIRPTLLSSVKKTVIMKNRIKKRRINSSYIAALARTPIKRGRPQNSEKIVR
jgi:antitoxin YefM